MLLGSPSGLGRTGIRVRVENQRMSGVTADRLNHDLLAKPWDANDAGLV